MNEKRIPRIARALINAIFPHRCPACRSLFHAPPVSGRNAASLENIVGLPARERFSRLMAAFTCRDCASRFSPVTSPICTKCGQMFETSAGDDHVCGDCATHETVYTAARSSGQYDGSLMQLIHAVKYRQRLRLTRPLGLLLFIDFLRYYADKRITLILPVPLHLSRLRQRGFNQSLLLVREWQKANRLLRSPVTDFEIDPGALVRNRKTRSQTGLKKDQRRTNIRGAFAVTAPDRIAGKSVLLVDDVYTTGSTVSECAAELKKHGAENIYVLTLARAM